MHPVARWILPLFFAASLLAQNPITIQQSTLQSIFSAGNPIRIYASRDTLSTVNVGQRGGSNVYDFSSLTFSLIKIDTFRQVSTIPHLASRFPGTALTLNISDNPSLKEHVLFLWDNNRIVTPGDYKDLSADSFLVTQSSPPELFLRFPISYPDSSGETSRITRSFYSRGTLTRSEQHDIPIHSIVDGYGTLRLPGGESRPCLRIRWYEQPPNYHYKSFRYVTDNGMILSIDTQNDQPDEGVIELDGPILLLRTSPLTAVSETTMPLPFSLSQNYPNPFNPATVISFTVPGVRTLRDVSLRVYNVLGQEVATLVAGKVEAGHHQVQWRADGLPSGIYLYRLETGQRMETKKLVLVR